jgi:hypothetical protein
MHILTNAWKLLLFLMILLCSMFPGRKIQWRTIWHSKHQVSEPIEENSVFRKKRMFRFAKPKSLVFSQCIVRESILLNQIQQKWTVLFLKPEGPEFPGLRMKQARQRRSILMIEGHLWYII